MLDKKVTPYGAYIRKYRIANGIYLSEFAEKMQLPVSYLRYLETGDETLPEDLEEKLIANIGISEAQEQINLHTAIAETMEMQKQEAEELKLMLEDMNGVRTPEITVQLGHYGIMPSRAHDTDAGYDLYASEDVLVTAVPTPINTGVHMLIPEGFCGLICPRSGLTSKGNTAAIGVIDAGYTGEIKVSMTTIKSPLHIKCGDRVAQMLIIPVVTPELKLGNVTNAVTERGANGFGSTGK